MRSMVNAVTLPLMNAALAKRTIVETMLTEDLKIWSKAAPRPNLDEGTPIFFETPIPYVVDLFMRRFPRGAGTSKNMRLRTLYAACATIKYRQSQTRRDRNRMRYRDGFKNLSDTQIAYLAAMPVDGGVTDKLIGRFVTADSLMALGLINGWYETTETGFRLADHWLSDDGMLLCQSVGEAMGARAIKKALDAGKLETKGEPDHTAAVRSIKSFAGHDAKTFIEHAKKVVALFD